MSTNISKRYRRGIISKKTKRKTHKHLPINHRRHRRRHKRVKSGREKTRNKKQRKINTKISKRRKKKYVGGIAGTVRHSRTRRRTALRQIGGAAAGGATPEMVDSLQRDWKNIFNENAGDAIVQPMPLREKKTEDKKHIKGELLGYDSQFKLCENLNTNKYVCPLYWVYCETSSPPANRFIVGNEDTAKKILSLDSWNSISVEKFDNAGDGMLGLMKKEAAGQVERIIGVMPNMEQEEHRDLHEFLESRIYNPENKPADIIEKRKDSLQHLKKWKTAIDAVLNTEIPLTDVKPENALVDACGNVWLIDFDPLSRTAKIISSRPNANANANAKVTALYAFTAWALLVMFDANMSSTPMGPDQPLWPNIAVDKSLDIFAQELSAIKDHLIEDVKEWVLELFEEMMQELPDDRTWQKKGLELLTKAVENANEWSTIMRTVSVVYSDTSVRLPKLYLSQDDTLQDAYTQLSGRVEEEFLLRGAAADKQLADEERETVKAFLERLDNTIKFVNNDGYVLQTIREKKFVKFNDLGLPQGDLELRLRDVAARGDHAVSTACTIM